MNKYIRILSETFIKKYKNIVNLLPASSLGKLYFNIKLI